MKGLSKGIKWIKRLNYVLFVVMCSFLKNEVCLIRCDLTNIKFLVPKETVALLRWESET